MNHPFLTREAARAVDQRAISEFGISSLVLMENAGRGCADVLCKLGICGAVVICCGVGNNGGDGFVIARQLLSRGHTFQVLLFGDPARLRGDALANYAVLQKIGVLVPSFTAPHETKRLAEQLKGADWIVDALLGTGSHGEPRPPLDAVIEQLNQHPAKKLAVDLPSGLDCETGQPARVTFRADHTCTFVAQKIGFTAESAWPYLGQVHVLDIGLPAELFVGNDPASTLTSLA